MPADLDVRTGTPMTSTIASQQDTPASDSGCCANPGVVAGHFIGLIVLLLLLPLGIDTLCRAYFADMYSPGSSAYFFRMWLLELLDLACVCVVFTGSGGSTGADRDTMYLPIVGNTLSLLLSSFWMWRGRLDALERRRLAAAIDDAAVNHCGQKHISEELERRITEFNAAVGGRFRSMKQTYSVFFGMEIGDLSFVGAQYAAFCSATACSFASQLATIISASMLVGSVRDLFTMRDCDVSPLLFSMDGLLRSDSAARPKALAQEQQHAYMHVRGLLDTVLEAAQGAAYSFCNPHVGVSPVSLLIYELDRKPLEDLRADAVVLLFGLARLLWRRAVGGEDISATALHLVAAAGTRVREEVEWLCNIDQLRDDLGVLRSAARLLPRADQEALATELGAWSRERASSRWTPQLVSGMDGGWDGLFEPRGEDGDGHAEYCLCGDAGDEQRVMHVASSGRWCLSTQASAEKGAKDRLRTAFMADGEGKLQEHPPTTGWQVANSSTRGEHADPGAKPGAGHVAVQALSTAGMRVALRCFLSSRWHSERALQGVARNFDIAINDDALLQWVHTKAVCLERSLALEFRDTAAMVGEVVHQIVVACERLEHGDELPSWMRASQAKLKEGSAGNFAPLLARAFVDQLRATALAQQQQQQLRLTASGDSVPLVYADGSDEPTDENAAESHELRLLREMLDGALHVEQFGPEEAWPLRCVLRHVASAPRARGLELGHYFALREQRRLSRQVRAVTVFLGRVVRLPNRAWFAQLLQRHAFTALVAAMYLIVFGRCARLMGTRERADYDAITFLKLPPQYTLSDPLQRALVPLLYAVMHCSLLTFGLLPLPMCRCTIRWLSSFPRAVELLHLEHVHSVHRWLGYVLVNGILLGATFWWFALDRSCVDGGAKQSCDAFNPPGSSFNFFSNGPAVLFLRVLVSIGLLAIFGTSLLVYPLGGAGSVQPLQRGWINDHAFEIFYFTHVTSAAAIVGLAFASRFTVFYPTAPAWGWYVLDVLYMRARGWVKTTTAKVIFSGHPARLVNLRLVQKKGWRRFAYRAGQTAFVQVPAISGLEWHPFSIASAPDDPHVEFLIDCGKYGPHSWTGKLWEAVAKQGLGATSSGFEVQLLGPCGSSFQAAMRYEGLVLVGAGSGLVSSLSVLRDIVHRRQRAAAAGRPETQRVWFIWITRHVDGLLWCWDGLKRVLSGDGASHAERTAHVAALEEWLDVSIHVTGCAGSAEERGALDRLLAAEDVGTAKAAGAGRKAKPDPAAAWLLHDDRLHRSRLRGWREKLLSVHSRVEPGTRVKVCFCGPVPMAEAISKAASSVEGFSVEVSSENFNEGKRMATPSAAAARPVSEKLQQQRAHRPGSFASMFSTGPAHSKVVPTDGSDVPENPMSVPIIAAGPSETVPNQGLAEEGRAPMPKPQPEPSALHAADSETASAAAATAAAVAAAVAAARAESEKAHAMALEEARTAAAAGPPAAAAATAAVEQAAPAEVSAAVGSRMKDAGARQFWLENGLPFSVPWPSFKMLFEMNFNANRQMSDALAALVQKELDLDGDGNIITAEFDRFCQQHPISSIHAWLNEQGLDEEQTIDI